MKKLQYKYIIIFLLVLIINLFTKDCISSNYKYNSPHYRYNPPEKLNDGWEISSLDSEGINTELIEYLINNIYSNKFDQYENIHSVLIIRNGKLLLEEYFNGSNGEILHDQHSVTKSFCSALVGIAIDHQFIKSVNDPIKIYLPEYHYINWEHTYQSATKGKIDITIHHLLTMSAGLEWDEWKTKYSDPNNSHNKMDHSFDQVKYVLERPLVAEPGTMFTYNSGLAIILGKIISNSINIEFDTFATKYLFEPLGINNHEWRMFPSGIYQTEGGLKLRPRDMAKFGLLYLNNGKWNNQQIISEKWIK